MNGVNKAIILGHLHNAPRIVTINSFSFCELLITTTEEWEDKKTGETKRTQHYITVKMMNQLSDICMKYLNKGSMVFIEAKINGRKYQTRDGGDGYALDLQGISMKMLDSLEPKKVRLTAFDSKGSTALVEDDLDDTIPF